MAIETETGQSSSLDALLAVFKDKRLCSGILPVPIEQLFLFYGCDEQFRRINTAKASSRDLDSLSSLCERKHLGVDGLRAVGELGPSHFATTLDVVGSGLAHIVHNELLEDFQRDGVRFVLRGLQVHERMSCLKAQEPSNDSEHIGTLIIVLPTPHQGGSFVIQNGERRWIHNSELDSYSLEGANPSVGYIAFLDGINYQVSSLLSGHMVTLTYHIYASPSGPSLPDPILIINPQATSLRSALLDLLRSPAFMPEGGLLGFPLTQPYVIAHNVNSTTNKFDRSRLLNTRSQNHDVIENLVRELKSGDGLFLRTCQDLFLNACVRVVYKTRKATIVCDHVVDFGYREVHEEEDVLIKAGGIIIQVEEHYQDYFEYRRDRSGKVPGSHNVHWIDSEKTVNQIAVPYVVGGSRGGLGCMYSDLYLMVDIPVPGARYMIPREVPTPSPSSL